MATVSEPPVINANLQQADIGRRYLKAAIHSGIGGVVSRALQGCAPIVLARYLGPN